jgi:hypothetical protein
LRAGGTQSFLALLATPVDFQRTTRRYIPEDFRGKDVQICVGYFTAMSISRPYSVEMIGKDLEGNSSDLFEEKSRNFLGGTE